MLGFRFKRSLFTCMAAGILLVSSLSGCGQKNSQELEQYKEGMTSFYDKLSYYDKAINGIDPSSEVAKQQLLGYLDEINENYKAMADTKVPEEFSGIADIAVEASDYMQMANECYHYAYDGAYDEENEALAFQYYGRANSRAMVILQVLHGQVPEGAGITVTTQEPGDFATIGDGDTQAEE